MARRAARQLAPCLAIFALALPAAGCGESREAAGAPAVFAAASLRDVAAEMAAEFERLEGIAVEFNLAASNTLAQQILAAPGADVFLSADRYWVEVLEEAGRIVAGSRRPLLGNRLVLIAGSASDIRVASPAELTAVRYSFLAVADPDAVPAGRYARRALEEISVDGGSLWQAVADRVAPTLDVRAALSLVESDPEILGIVYRTDALGSSRVRVLHEFPGRGGARVTYYGALIEDGDRPDLGRRFLDFAAGPEGRRIAVGHGFTEPAR